MCELPLTIRYMPNNQMLHLTSSLKRNPWPWVQVYFFSFDQDNNPTRMSGICFTKTSNTYYFSIDYFSLRTE